MSSSLVPKSPMDAIQQGLFNVAIQLAKTERDAEWLAKISEMENRSNEVTSSHPTRQYAMELLRELRLWAEKGAAG